jgi:hypothetical protein
MDEQDESNNANEILIVPERMHNCQKVSRHAQLKFSVSSL